MGHTAQELATSQETKAIRMQSHPFLDGPIVDPLQRWGGLLGALSSSTSYYARLLHSNSVLEDPRRSDASGFESPVQLVAGPSLERYVNLLLIRPCLQGPTSIRRERGFR